MSRAAEALERAVDLLTKLYEPPSLTGEGALALIDKELPVLRAAIDDAEWTEKGLEEWRDMAQSNDRQAKAARATARIAIGHLQAVLAKGRAHDEQPAGDAARDWLTSIGAE